MPSALILPANMWLWITKTVRGYWLLCISCLLLVFIHLRSCENAEHKHKPPYPPASLSPCNPALADLSWPLSLIHVQVLRIERVLLEHECKESCFCFRICKSSGPFHIVNDTEEILSFVVSPDPNQLKLTKLAVQVPTKQLMCSSATSVILWV